MNKFLLVFLAANCCQALLADSFAPAQPYDNYDQSSFRAAIPSGYELVPLTSAGAPIATASSYTAIYKLTLDDQYTFTNTVGFGFGKYDFGEMTFSKPIYGFAGIWDLGTNIIAGNSFGPPDQAHLQLTGYDIDHNPTYGFQGFWGTIMAVNEISAYTGQENAITILPDYFPIPGLSPHLNQFGGGFSVSDIEVIVATPEPCSLTLFSIAGLAGLWPLLKRVRACQT